MPSAKSARVSERRRQRNAPLRTRAKSALTRVRRLIAADDLEGAEQAMGPAIISLDKAAQKGALHRNNTARRKSRLMKMLNKARNAAQ